MQNNSASACWLLQPSCRIGSCSTVKHQIKTTCLLKYRIMFSTTIITPSSSSSFSVPQLSSNSYTHFIISAKSNSKSKLDSFFKNFYRKSLQSKPVTQLLFKVPNQNGFSSQSHHSIYTSSRRSFRPVMESQDCTLVPSFLSLSLSFSSCSQIYYSMIYNVTIFSMHYLILKIN